MADSVAFLQQHCHIQQYGVDNMEWEMGKDVSSSFGGKVWGGGRKEKFFFWCNLSKLV